MVTENRRIGIPKTINSVVSLVVDDVLSHLYCTRNDPWQSRNLNTPRDYFKMQKLGTHFVEASQVPFKLKAPTFRTPMRE